MYLLLCASHFKSQRCYVVRYVVRYCEFKPEWSQLQLDLFLIFIVTYSRHLHCLLYVYYV